MSTFRFLLKGSDSPIQGKGAVSGSRAPVGNIEGMTSKCDESPINAQAVFGGNGDRAHLKPRGLVIVAYNDTRAGALKPITAREVWDFFTDMRLGTVSIPIIHIKQQVELPGTDMAPVNPEAVNKWAGRIVPAFLAGTVAYATYVFVAQLCVDFLLKGHRPRPGISAALLAIYFILCLFMTITYARLVYIVTVDPGYLPLGAAAKRYNKGDKNVSLQNNGAENRANDALGPEYRSSETAIIRDDGADSPGLELFYTKDIFVCSQDGRPKWVGGVVGENSFKFFVQFVAYAFFYCLFVVVVAAIYLSEDLSITANLNGHIVALVAVSGFFGLFTFGMACSSLQFVLANLTTIENLSKKSRAWLLAVLIPPTFNLPQQGNYPHITYPLPLPASEKSSPSAPSSPASAPHDGIISEPEALSDRDSRATRTFAILQLAVGRNPWDLGAVGNWKSVMGNNFLDWVLPITQSPCRNHESHESQFKTGRWVEELLVEVGFMSEQNMHKPRPFGGRKLKGPKPSIIEKNGVKPAMTAECIPRNAH
ncbi:hypothetical protein V493_07288 [Pseudogymnoascus sp. VKM F-4281 (FW-2241)]|nr:hypothetical protein V493_07288 [Pseudogymnoascus sp. VKM F-4281 (FW-2241)]